MGSQIEPLTVEQFAKDIKQLRYLIGPSNMDNIRCEEIKTRKVESETTDDSWVCLLPLLLPLI